MAFYLISGGIVVLALTAIILLSGDRGRLKQRVEQLESEADEKEQEKTVVLELVSNRPLSAGDAVNRMRGTKADD